MKAPPLSFGHFPLSRRIWAEATRPPVRPSGFPDCANRRWFARGKGHIAFVLENSPRPLSLGHLTIEGRLRIGTGERDRFELAGLRSGRGSWGWLYARSWMVALLVALVNYGWRNSEGGVADFVMRWMRKSGSIVFEECVDLSEQVYEVVFDDSPDGAV